MAKKSVDLKTLLVGKGHGSPSPDAPSRTSERTRPSRYLVNLGFKVPREFRHHVRKLAANQDISMVEVLRQALKLYEDQL